VPVSVEGGLWGVMVVASRAGPLPAGTEAQLARFTELAATAIAKPGGVEAGQSRPVSRIKPRSDPSTIALGDSKAEHS